MTVPPSLGGAVSRCPNHPEVLAVGLCNDCGGSFCDSCLHRYDVEHGTLYLCSNCCKEREEKKGAEYLVIGSVSIFFAFLLIVGAGLQAAFASILFLFGGLSLIAFGIYKESHFPEGLTLKEIADSVESEMESRKAFGSQASTYDLYRRLLSDSLRDYGPRLGSEILERTLNYYEDAGMTRTEAIRKLAEEKGY